MYDTSKYEHHSVRASLSSAEIFVSAEVPDSYDNPDYISKKWSDDPELNSQAKAVSLVYRRTMDIKHSEDTLNFALRFYKLSSIYVDILLFLHKEGGAFVGGYSALTAALGRPTKPKSGHVPNIRKSIISLEEKGMIFTRKNDKGTVLMIMLNTDWLDRI